MGLSNEKAPELSDAERRFVFVRNLLLVRLPRVDCRSARNPHRGFSATLFFAQKDWKKQQMDEKCRVICGLCQNSLADHSTDDSRSTRNSLLGNVSEGVS